MRFGIFDNFYADAEVTADGHNWITQANSTDYIDKTWPFNYSPSPRDATRDFDFGNDVAYPGEPLSSDPALTRPGMTIELLGPDYGVDEVAAEAGTIGYEILTALGARHHRVYRGLPAE